MNEPVFGHVQAARANIIGMQNLLFVFLAVKHGLSAYAE